MCRKAAVAYGWPPTHPSGGRRCSSWRTARSGFCGRCAFWCLFSCTRYVTGAHLPLALCLSKQQPRPRCSHQSSQSAGVGHAPGWQFHSWQRQIWQTWCIAQGTNCKPGSSARISALTQQGHQAPCWQIHGWQQHIWCCWWMARAVIRVPLSTRHLWCVCCCSTVMSGAI